MSDLQQLCSILQNHIHHFLRLPLSYFHVDNSVKKWCDANGIANIVTDDSSGEGWTKKPTDTKAVEFLDSDWTVLENGSTNFENWAVNNAASWLDTVNLFDKFKTWIAASTYTTIRHKNMVYRGVVENLADLERGATLKELGRNFDEGKNLVGTENIIKEGYSKVTDKLVTMITAFPNCQIKLNEKVTKIKTVVDASAGYVSTVTTNGGTHLAPRIVVTLPLGVLKANTIVFDPALPTDKTNAIAKLGVGLLNKISILYSKNFWTNDVNELGPAMWFTVLDPTALNLTIGAEPPKPQREFWNAAKYFSKPVVTMLYGATTADDYEKLTDAEVVKIADDLFRSLWTGTSDAVIKGYNISRWRADEHAKGSYSYLPPGASVQNRNDLCKYLNNGIYWAGEHCSVDYPATVHGAFDSGTSAVSAIPVKPTTSTPTSSKPTSLKPTSLKPTSLKPTSSKPASLKPTSSKPTSSKPTSLKPTSSKPSSSKPSSSKPTSSKPTLSKPTSSKPTSSKPS